MSLFNPDLSFNRAAIFREAWGVARSQRRTDQNVHFNGKGPEAKNVRAYFAAALRHIWKAARKEREEFQRTTPEQRAMQAQFASAMFGAQMIDNTRESFAVQQAIRQRFTHAFAA